MPEPATTLMPLLPASTALVSVFAMPAVLLMVVMVCADAPLDASATSVLAAVATKVLTVMLDLFIRVTP